MALQVKKLYILNEMKLDFYQLLGKLLFNYPSSDQRNIDSNKEDIHMENERKSTNAML